jgi:hypothetical protein
MKVFKSGRLSTLALDDSETEQLLEFCQAIVRAITIGKMAAEAAKAKTKKKSKVTRKGKRK